MCTYVCVCVCVCICETTHVYRVVSTPGGTRHREDTLSVKSARQRTHRRSTSTGQVLAKLVKRSSWGEKNSEATVAAETKRSVREGWMMIQDPSTTRRRLRSTKFLCKYFVIYKGGWVVFYDSAHCNPKEIGGWIALHQCDIDMSGHRDVSKSFVEITNKNKQLIFHLRGPPALQDVVPAEYLPKVIWRKSCYRIKLRPTGEQRDGTLLEWTAALKEGIASSMMTPQPNPSNSGLTDGEDEEEYGDVDSDDGPPTDESDAPAPAASTSSRQTSRLPTAVGLLAGLGRLGLVGVCVRVCVCVCVCVCLRFVWLCVFTLDREQEIYVCICTGNECSECVCVFVCVALN
jgi:hypothetical protein